MPNEPAKDGPHGNPLPQLSLTSVEFLFVDMQASLPPRLPLHCSLSSLRSHVHLLQLPAPLLSHSAIAVDAGCSWMVQGERRLRCGGAAQKQRIFASVPPPSLLCAFGRTSLRLFRSPLQCHHVWCVLPEVAWTRWCVLLAGAFLV